MHARRPTPAPRAWGSGVGILTPTGSLLTPHGPVRVPVPDFWGQDGTPAQGGGLRGGQTRNISWKGSGRTEGFGVGSRPATVTWRQRSH